MPSKGGKATGWLQILLIFEDERAQVTETRRKGVPADARCPVFLNYYDLGHSTSIAYLNKISPYGAFHAGIEMYDTEFSYGGTQRDVTGIFVSRPRRCAMHSYKGTIYLGDCSLKKPQIEALLKKLRKEWWGPHYDILKKNCCFFCREFAILLGLGEIPNWTYRLANLGASLRDALHITPQVDDQLVDINAVLIEHIMAVRMQRQFRARQARRAAGIPTPVSSPADPKFFHHLLSSRKKQGSPSDQFRTRASRAETLGDDE